MSEKNTKISIEEVVARGGIYKRTLLSSAILNALGCDRSFDDLGPDVKEIEVGLTINGRPADLRSFFKHLDSEMDRLIEEEAKNLLRKKFSMEDHTAMNDIQKMIEKMRNQLFEKYFSNDPEFINSQY